MAIEAPAMKEIPLSQGKVALVDDVEFDLLSVNKWCAQKDRRTYYAVRSITIAPNKEKRVWMHREILGLTVGQFADHINGNGLDNRRSNLRIATTSQNGANRRVGRNNTSGVKGVAWHKGSKKWQSSICVRGRMIQLGRFYDLKSAECIYKLAAFKFFGEFAGEPK